MSDQPHLEDGGRPTGEATLKEMRLRPSRPSVTRLSRKVLVGLGVVAATGIGGALFFALRSHPQAARSELYNTENHATPDGLANLPRDYAGLPKSVPKLGPPLPGDLGRPILNAGAPSPGMVNGAATASTPQDPEKQRLVQERDDARTGHLFASTNVGQAVEGAQGALSLGASGSAAASQATKPPTSDPKLAFLGGDADHATVSSDRIEAPASPYLLQAGGVIAAALITGLRSDLPGKVTAQVTEDVFDSVTGRVLLIPQGARLIGQYDAQVSFGQSRALLVWNRLIMPNGRSIVLERQPGADPQGYAGLEDTVNDHWGTLFKAAILSTVLSVGAEAGTSNSNTSLVQALGQGASDSISQTGRQVVQRSLNVEPTITIRPGFPVRVMITRDLVLEPYRG